MNFNVNGLLKEAVGFATKHSPAIFTGLGISGFVVTVVMTAKAAPVVSYEHDIFEQERYEKTESGCTKDDLKDSYLEEAKVLAPAIIPPVITGVASIACVLAAHKIQSDRKAAVLTAYSLSEKTLTEYQRKVIEKLGEEQHEEILKEATKDIVRNDVPEGFDHEKYVVPEGMVRIYDNVTGRYFFSTKERVMKAESEINKRLLNEVRVPLQEFYYAMGMEERFNLGEILGWDLSSPYANDNGPLDVWFAPMLDDDKNPCLALNYHVMVFSRSI